MSFTVYTVKPVLEDHSCGRPTVPDMKFSWSVQVQFIIYLSQLTSANLNVARYPVKIAFMIFICFFIAFMFRLLKRVLERVTEWDFMAACILFNPSPKYRAHNRATWVESLNVIMETSPGLASPDVFASCFAYLYDTEVPDFDGQRDTPYQYLYDLGQMDPIVFKPFVDMALSLLVIIPAVVICDSMFS